jgi:hypothetical protein
MQGSAKDKFRVVVAALLCLAVLTAIYFAAYLALGKRGTVAGPTLNGEAQYFSHDWQVELFLPAATLESLIRGKTVYVLRWDGN